MPLQPTAATVLKAAEALGPALGMCCLLTDCGVILGCAALEVGRDVEVYVSDAPANVWEIASVVFPQRLSLCWYSDAMELAERVVHIDEGYDLLFLASLNRSARNSLGRPSTSKVKVAKPV